MTLVQTVCNSTKLCNTEQESQRALQEFSQKMESLKREHELEMESLVHEAQLKQKDAEVSYFIMTLSFSVILSDKVV